MIDKILEKLAKPMKHPFLNLILFYFISFIAITLLLSFDLIKLKTAEISMLLSFTIIPLAFYCFKGLCIEDAYKNKTSFIPGIIITVITVVIVLFFISGIPNSTKTYTKTINLKNDNVQDCISVSSEVHSRIAYNYIHCKKSKNKAYKIQLSRGTKINWKKGKKNEVKLIMNDKYSVFGCKIESKATNVTVYYKYQ